MIILGSIGKGVVNFLLVLIELLSLDVRLRPYDQISVQNRRFRSNGGRLTYKFLVEGVAPHQPFFLSEN